jgi:hypothetical protein
VHDRSQQFRRTPEELAGAIPPGIELQIKDAGASDLQGRLLEARFIAERGVLAEGAPVLALFIAQIASRFGVVVAQKLAAQAVSARSVVQR